MTSRRALAGALAIAPLALLLIVMSVAPPTDLRTSELLGVLLPTTIVAALVAAGAAVLSRVVPQAWSRWVVSAAGAVGWGALAGYVVPAGLGLLATVVGVVAGWVVHRVHGLRRPDRAELELLVPERSRVQALRGRAVRPVEPWSTAVASRLLRGYGWGLVVIFAVVLVLMVVQRWSPWLVLTVGVVGVGTGLVALAWSRVRVDVDEAGLRVRSLVLPTPLLRVPAEEVAGVEVSVLDPMRWGGVGLRPLPDSTAYIVTAGGPGLVVYGRDGRRLALEVTEGDQVARAGARTLLQAAGQRLGEVSTSA